MHNYQRDADPVFIIRHAFRKTFEALAWYSQVYSYIDPEETPGLFSDIWKELGLKGAKLGAELGFGPNRVELPGRIFLELLKESNFVDAMPLIKKVRLIKSELELERIRKSAKINAAAYERFFSKFKVGMTEREAANLLAGYMCEEGADRPFFVLVRTAERMLNGLSCAFPIDKKIQKGDYVQLEIGADYRHYVTEAKVVLLAGVQPKPSAPDHYRAYVEAAKKGQDAARPGATAADVFQAAKKTFEEHGIKVPPERKSFGHGLGLDGHEPPVISPLDRTPLQPGMTFVVEVGGLTNADGLFFSKSQTTIVTSGASEKLPPLAEEIVAI